METFINICFIVICCLGVIFRKYFAKEMAGSWGQKYTDRELKMYERICLFLGVTGAIFGIVVLIGKQLS
jgi:hypothetical protein